MGRALCCKPTSRSSKRRQKVLEKEIDDALSHAPIDDPMIAHLKSRILYVKEEIDRLRHEALRFSTIDC